ncbi:MAG: hypothetical protein GF311_01295 [Candidatus Lokiarchaeota archaeon]|nr:hypothetical protein [Candidatus Lokiarchaeota archaeon]
MSFELFLSKSESKKKSLKNTLKIKIFVWNNYTFRTLLEELSLFDDTISETIEGFKKTGFYHQVCDRRINGSSVENLNHIYNNENLNRNISLT